MEYAIAIVGICAVAFWFAYGQFNNRMRERDKEEAAHHEALSDNRKADDLLRDPDHVKRLRDKYND